MEVVRTVGAGPLDLNIFAAGEEISRAGAGELHGLTAVAVDGLGGNVEDDNVCKVYRAVVAAVDVLISAYKCMVAFLVRIILKGGIVVRVVDGEICRGVCALGNCILCKAETIGVVIAAVVLKLVIVLAEGSELAAVGKKGVLNVLALAETSLIAVVAGSFTGTSAEYACSLPPA